MNELPRLANAPIFPFVRLAAFLPFIFPLLSSCADHPTMRVVSIENTNVGNINNEYRDYCQRRANIDAEQSAVLATFAGEYAASINYATEDHPSFDQNNWMFAEDSTELGLIVQGMSKELESGESSNNDQQALKRWLSALQRPRQVGKVFKTVKAVSAKDYILSRADSFSFILVNEAHYCSDHRQFTRNLLEPLWSKGYRYLALETLTPGDPINTRGYPVYSSGYYTRDVVFSNMVREALRIGYKLIAYDVSSLNSNLRDSLQAKNIYDQYTKESPGKVLIHAGYSHIVEFSDDNHRPMGAQLKRLLGADVLTVDQVTMMSFRDSLKEHSYYRAAKSYLLSEPTVFAERNGESLVDPLNTLGIDVQVYHPTSQLDHGRPKWMIAGGSKLFELSLDLRQYSGTLLQVFNPGESKDASPLDQVVVSDSAAVVVAPGSYRFRIVRCDGSVEAQGTIECLP